MPLTKRTVMDAFNKTTFYEKDPEIGFGTAARPSLVNSNNTPGPGTYAIKTTMKRTIISDYVSPPAFSIRSRQKFGDPNERSLNKHSALEPGPGHYNLDAKFVNPAKAPEYTFPKASQMTDKSMLAPAPGAYEPLNTFGKQIISTKESSPEIGFLQAPRPSLVQPGAIAVGPGEYGAPPAACARQVESKKRSCATVKIGGGFQKVKGYTKKVTLDEPSPGPGSYVLPGGIATQQKGTPFRNSAKISLSGREKFGSPF
jgi:hypothetical protein